MHALRRDLGHLDATLKLLDPGAEPRTIKPVRPYRPRNRVFARKELSIRVMNALREADGALTIDAIAERIIGDKGLKPEAGAMVRRVAAIALNTLRRRGIVALSNEATPQWKVAG